MSPLQLIEHHPGTEKGVRLYLKRDDLLKPPLPADASAFLETLQGFVQGNKWRKLAPIVEKALAGRYIGLLTYGGPFSNHLHATAAAGKLFGIPTAAIVRGLTETDNNPTLRFAQACGMQLHRVAKRDYDHKANNPVITAIQTSYPGYFDLPEGGSTAESVQNCRQIALEIGAQLNAAEPLWENRLTVAIPAGTGCTAAGLRAGLNTKNALLVFPAAPYGVDEQSLRAFGATADNPASGTFHVVNDYIFGEFAVFRPELLTFARAFKEQTGILLDPIYTVKMMFGLFDLLRRNFFPENSILVAVHTGGLQGWTGFRQRFGYNESWCAYTGLPS